MTEQLNVQQMAERLCAADNILVLCHKNPDGDTIGCGSALYYALKALEKTTAVLCSDTVPSRYAFTNPRLFKGEFEPRTVIAVDVAGLQLFGENNGVPQFARHVDLCIDHHAGNNGYADFTLLDAGAAAAAELLYQVIVEMGVPITPHIADCLYTGIATDTGCFRFNNTTADTLRCAAACKDTGADTFAINTALFMTKRLPRLQLEARLTEEMEFYAGGAVAVNTLPNVLLVELGLTEDDVDDISGFSREIAGVEIGVMLREGPDGGKISLRCSPKYDAAAICARLGGGGHRGAAGASVPEGLDAAKKAILQAIADSGVEL